MKKERKQMSESMALAIVLTLAGGFQDAYSYNCRGGVFANGQTGNIVLLGQNLAMGDWGRAFRYLCPIIAFIGGVYLSEAIGQFCKEHKKIHWRQIVLIIEIAMLILAGFLPQTFNIPANVMLSFACAMQVHAFRKFHGIPSATTMCLGNLRSATEMMCKYHFTKDPEMKRKSLHYYFIIFIFAVGAAVGAILSNIIGNYAIWVSAVLLLAGFIMMFVKEDLDPRII